MLHITENNLMMNRRWRHRTRHEIYHDILMSCPGKKTHLAYRAQIANNTDHAHYIEYLEKVGLIKYNLESKQYHITKRGKRYLSAFEAMKEVVK